MHSSNEGRSQATTSPVQSQAEYHASTLSDASQQFGLIEYSLLRRTKSGRKTNLMKTCVESEGFGVAKKRSAKPLCVGSIPTRASNLSSALLPLAVGGFSSVPKEFLRISHAVFKKKDVLPTQRRWSCLVACVKVGRRKKPAPPLPKPYGKNAQAGRPQ